MIAYRDNPRADDGETPNNGLDAFSQLEAAGVLAYHQSWPQYHDTPLWSLAHLAEHWGLGALWVKDESFRWGLNAFKSLGSTYALGRYLSRRAKWGGAVAEYTTLRRLARDGSPLTFCTATDGNHGVGVAWAARQLGYRAIIFMPKGSASSRVDAVRAVGGEVEVTPWGYDQTVTWADKQAVRRGWVLMQDTAWQGYTEIPLWIMQGYLTLVSEIVASLGHRISDGPSHVFLQAGVGSFAAAVTAMLVQSYPENVPQIVVVEPSRAAPFFASAGNRAGGMVAVSPSSTIMAGLNCGVGNPLAWPILRRWAAGFIACEDQTAARGMRILGHPLPGDPAIVAGESGAVGLGVLSLIMERHPELVERLGLGGSARVLVMNTEGATDPSLYRRVLWDGDYPSGPKVGSC